jgi:hypothetical protein
MRARYYKFHGYRGGDMRRKSVLKKLAIDKSHRDRLMNYGILIETLNGKPLLFPPSLLLLPSPPVDLIIERLSNVAG